MKRRTKTGGGPGTNQYEVRGSTSRSTSRANPTIRDSVEQAATPPPPVPDGEIEEVELPRPERVSWWTRKRRRIRRWLEVRRGDPDPFLPPPRRAGDEPGGPSAEPGSSGSSGDAGDPPAGGSTETPEPDDVALLNRHFGAVDYSDEEIDAVLDYCRERDSNGEWWFRRINRHIRAQGDQIDLDAAEAADRIDDALAKASTPKPLVVYRGLRDLAPFGATYDTADQLVGATRVLTGYQSTTLDPAVASTDFAGPPGEGAVLELIVPADNEAVWMPAIDRTSRFQYQQELLLNTGQAITIRSVSQKTGTLWVTCQILG